MDKLKTIVKQGLSHYRNRCYLKKMADKIPSFDDWIRKEESGLERYDMSLEPGVCDAVSDNLHSGAQLVAHLGGYSIRIIPYSYLEGNFKLSLYIEDIIVFVDGELTDRALPLITGYFTKHPECSIIYGDEDIATIDMESSNRYGKTVYGSRREPYFKPDWSPHAFLSHFYFCNICAIKRGAFRDLSFENGLSGAAMLYHVLIKYLFEGAGNIYASVGHIDEILVHARNYSNNDITDKTTMSFCKKMNVLLQNSDNSVISTVICTKNHPEILRECLSTLQDSLNEGTKVEVIVVDNGSDSDKKAQNELLSKEFSFKYIYGEMPFNFSKMCNIGAKEASGSVILLLNDDVTFVEKGTIERMYELVSLSFTGAVGAKLLYPDETHIQHAGIINNRIGPVHKLQFFDDSKSLAFGFNRYLQNVLAVTGACLMVRKDVYDKLGGLDENLKVAFNDVDFGFRLSESGMFNVVCNDIKAIHHESLTRGNDSEVDALNRLMSEKEKLYELHPTMRASDPYYNKHLLSDCLDARIVPASEYSYGACTERQEKVVVADELVGTEDKCLLFSIEYCGDLAGYTYGNDDPDDLYFQGYEVVSGSNNACFLKSIILKNETKTVKIPFEGCFRRDVSLGMADQTNVELSGFAVRVPKGIIPTGTYRVGGLAEGTVGHEKIYTFSNRFITV